MPAEFNANQKFNKLEAVSPDVSSPENDDELMWELLSLYADGEASSEEAAQVERMLRHDAEYARAYSFMQKAGGAIRTIVEVEPPAHLRDSILAKTTRKPTLARRAAAVFGAFRVQMAAPVGRLAFAGGGLAAAALVIGIYSGRTNSVTSTPASDAVANTTRSGRPAAATPDVNLPVYKVPDTLALLEPSVPLPNNPTKPDNSVNPVVAVKPTPALNTPLIPFGPQLAQMGMNVSASSTVKPAKLSPAPVLPKNSSRPVFVKYETPPVRHTELRGTEDSIGTQNVNPMMDANVQHRTAPMVIASISPAGSAGGSKSVSADTDDLNDNNVLIVHDTTTGAATTTAAADSSPESGRKIVGRLILSKLPPSSRHLMSPADAIREANSRSLVSYNATSSEEAPHRSADVPVLKGSF